MLKIPTLCPSCDSKLDLVKDQLFCRNIDCEAKKAQKTLKFAKTMKIMGLGEKTLEKLNVDYITKIYDLQADYLNEKLGEKTGTKVLAEINKSKTTKLSTFLTAMSIPLIGKTASEKVANLTSNIDDIDIDLCKKAGLGDKAAISLINWVNKEYNNYKYLPIVFESTKPADSNDTILKVCISGKIPGYTKAKIKEYLDNYSVLVKDNVTKDLDYLITQESNTAKAQKAEAYNIKIINFDKFKEILNNE